MVKILTKTIFLVLVTTFLSGCLASNATGLNPGHVKGSEAKEIIAAISILPVQEIDLTMVNRAIDTHKMYQISYWDALIVSAAERVGCTLILSEDLSDGQTYHNMVVRNPFTEEFRT